MYTSEIEIEEFLNEYKRSRIIIETSVRAVLKRALDQERIFGKCFYEFTIEEILKMYTEAHTRSVRSISNWNLILKHASLWFLDKQNKQLDNAYDNITKEQLKKCVDENLIDQMMISREQLTIMQDELINETDKAILELLFLGVTGGDWMRELTYLVPGQVSHEYMCIYFKTGKVVPIDNRAYNILQNAFDETEIVSYNGTIKVSKVSGNGIYKMRCNTLHANNDPKDNMDAERRARWLQRRLKIMSDYLDVRLTPMTINASGLWHECHKQMAISGIEDFKTYISTEEGRKLAKRYGFDSENYVYILVEKFRRYL